MKLSVKNSIRTALLGTAAVSMVLAGTGAASAHHNPGEALSVGAAGTAVTATPGTDDYKVCGNVVIGNPGHLSGVSATDRPVKNVHITGNLYSSSTDTTSDATFSTTTDAEGRWCIQGDATMASKVQGGGEVRMTADPMTFTDGGVTYTGKWSNNGGDATLRVGDFLSHAYGIPVLAKSAWKVNLQFTAV